MARMIPSLNALDLAQVTSRAERDVYAAFRDQLPSQFVVIHGLDLVTAATGASPRDAEADFVVFHPNRGFTTIEVKGGGVSFDGETRKWRSRDRTGASHELKDPFKQAKDAKFEILAALKANKSWGAAGMPEITMGHGVLFPDLLEVAAFVGPDRPIAIIGGAKAVTNIPKWTEELFDFWQGDRKPQALGARGMTVVEQVFCQRASVDVPLVLELERERRRQIELTDRQSRVLRALARRTRASIAGGAGTGKTVLALQHALKLAREGRETLLLCYNRALADFLKRETQGVASLTTLSFHQLCDWRIRSARAKGGVELDREAALLYPRESLYDVQLPYALGRSLDVAPIGYDAILVDEGQDFGEEYWLPIELLLRGQDALIYVFFDPNQAVYRTARSFPIRETPFLLTENCRNTRPIHELAYRHYAGDIIDPPELEGAPAEQLIHETLDSQAQAIRKLVTKLTTNERVAPSDIVVLVACREKAGRYEALKRAGAPGVCQWSFEQLWKQNSVTVDSVRRFKGLEASIVVLWGLDLLDEQQRTELLYVAFSRARSRLFLVGTAEEIDLLLKAQAPA